MKKPQSEDLYLYDSTYICHKKCDHFPECSAFEYKHYGEEKTGHCRIYMKPEYFGDNRDHAHCYVKHEIDTLETYKKKLEALIDEVKSKDPRIHTEF